MSAGCTNCYAERAAHKLASNPNPKIAAAYAGLTQITNGRPAWTGVFREMPDRLDQPLKWRQPKRIFVNSMSDLFGEGISDAFIHRVFAVMGSARQHQFQVLTKRPERAQRLLAAAEALFHVQCEAEEHCAERGWCHMGEDRFPWPLPNVWLGVSCEDQKSADTRIPLLLQTPAAIRFISAEPLLGFIRLETAWIDPDNDWEPGFKVNGGWTRLNWVIVGAESGPDARPMNEEWVRSLKKQCVWSDTAFFYKQAATSTGRKIHTPELDGRRWLEYPA